MSPTPAPTGRGGDPVITLEHVVKRFGGYVAVEEANFAIGRGEFFSLLGPSGCGKTTTLRMIAGFELPTSGRILLDGRDVSRVPPYRRNVNTVFQHYALFPHMTVADNVAFGPRSQKVDARETASRVEKLLAVVRLTQFADRKPAQLSGGQQQRVALARALANYPSALLLDEPLGALDLKLRQAMQIELKRIQREVGITFIYVTHDQEEALTMSDRIAVMNDGRVEQIGTPQEIYHSPTSVFVANFIGVANLIPAVVRDPGGADATVMVAGRHAVPVPCGGQVLRSRRRRHDHGAARAAAAHGGRAGRRLGRTGDGRARGVSGPGRPVHAPRGGPHGDRGARGARAVAPGPPARPRPLGGLGYQRGPAAAPGRRRRRGESRRRLTPATHDRAGRHAPPPITSATVPITRTSAGVSP